MWGIVGPRKSDFLEILAGKLIPEPAIGRTYPVNSHMAVSNTLQFLNFKESSGLDKVHMAARYESYSYKGQLETSDDVNSVANYVTGANNYNKSTSITDVDFLNDLFSLFDLKALSRKWINSLSNGQMRRARLAKAIYKKPKLLIVDDPFLGLDPSKTKTVSEAVREATEKANISVVMGLRVQDKIPEWVTHVAFAGESGLEVLGERNRAVNQVRASAADAIDQQHNAKSNFKLTAGESVSDAIIEFENASVVYKSVPVLQNFSWKIKRGSRWRILGDNGTGKTTILSLITADHPQSWRSVLKVNGVVRKPGVGVSYFELNDEISISSPELHAIVPPHLTMRQIIYNGLIPGIGNANFHFKFDEEKAMPSHASQVLRAFDDYVDDLMHMKFCELTIAQQKLTLFLRAIMKAPKILILDEAFSCVDDILIVKRCFDYLDSNLASATILCIGHIDWEIPRHDHILELREERQYRIFDRV